MPSFCQHMLCLTESWLTWSGMAVNGPKSVAVAIKASTGRAYNLTLSGQPIPYLSDTTFQFLGTPMGILVTKLSTMMQSIDDTSVTRRQKPKLFKVSICPRLTWDLSISDLPVSWLWNSLQPIATRYLKRWSGLSRSASPNHLFLPKSNGGLDLPHLLTVYKKIQATKAGSHMFSRDSSVRATVTLDTLHEASLQRVLFSPHQEVVEVMKENQEHPGSM